MNDSLRNQEIVDFCDQHTAWRWEDNALKAQFILPSFESAIAVINKIADAAAHMDHHPWLANVYNKLEFSLQTHDAGDLVTDKDIALAKEISEIIEASI
jgi:4a-hydroxytetrahydrobiopterin dehydratase